MSFSKIKEFLLRSNAHFLSYFLHVLLSASLLVCRIFFFFIFDSCFAVLDSQVFVILEESAKKSSPTNSHAIKRGVKA